MMPGVAVRVVVASGAEQHVTIGGELHRIGSGDNAHCRADRSRGNGAVGGDTDLGIGGRELMG